MKRFQATISTGLLQAVFFVFCLTQTKKYRAIRGGSHINKFVNELLPPVVYDEAAYFYMDMS